VIGLGMSALKVYLAVEPCDMRKGFQGLSVAAVEHLGQSLTHDAKQTPRAGQTVML
jgi:hypothetical protein